MQNVAYTFNKQGIQRENPETTGTSLSNLANYSAFKGFWFSVCREVSLVHTHWQAMN